MEGDDELHTRMKKLVEASYLTADSAAYYRSILRYFYEQHEKMRDYIAPEEVFAYMRSIPAFQEYEEELMHQQLAQLVKWNNLVARQDMTNAKTIEEYKKKRFRYICTPYTVEIERMLIQLEKMSDQFQGSLEPSQFERLLQTLTDLQMELESPLIKPTETYMQTWEDLMHYFRTIRTNTADYIAYINSEETDQRMQSEAFLIYKNQFSIYLRDFIVSLQKTALQIQQRLRELSTEPLTPFFEKLIEHRKEIPRLDDVATSENEWLNEYKEYWYSISRWFLGIEGQSSELDMLQWQTNEMIRRMTRYVQRLGERDQHFRSRKTEYLQLAKWFENSLSLDEAHQLSSVVFGSMSIQHLQMDHVATENLYTDTWDELAVILPIKPRTNQYREKTKPSAFRSNAKEKEQQRRIYLQQQEQERAVIQQYIDKKSFHLAELDRIEPFFRKILLYWIGKAMANEDRMVLTDYNVRVKVTVKQDEHIILQAEDGVLHMPNVYFQFQH